MRFSSTAKPARQQVLEPDLHRHVTREVRDHATGALQVHADYSQLGTLLIVQILLGLALPFGAILFARLSKFRSA